MPEERARVGSNDPEIERLKEGLFNAHKAGDGEAAEHFAGLLRGIEERPIQEPPGMFGQARDFIVKQGGKVEDWAIDAYRGPPGLPDLPEFDQPTGRGFGQDLKVGAGLLASVDPEQEADIVSANYPDVSLFPVQVPNDDRLYHIAQYTDPETGQEREEYLNKPGLSGVDVRRIGGQGALYALTAGRGNPAAGALRSMATQGTRAGLTSVGLDVAAEKAGSQQGVSIPRALIAGGAGALFEGLSPVAIQTWRRIMGQSKYYDYATKTLTQEGKDAARRQGLNPEEMERRIELTFAEMIDNSVDPATAGRVARTGEFKITPTRGQAMDDYRSLNQEDRMAHGLEGDVARTVMRDFRNQQNQAVEGAVTGIQSKFTGTGPLTREAEAGRLVQESLEGRAKTLAGQIDEAYEVASGGLSAMVSNRALRDLDELVATIPESRIIDRQLTPATVRGLKNIKDMSASNGLTFKAIETERRKLNQLIDAASNKTDRSNLLAVKRTFDDWLDDTVDKGLMSGDPRVLAQLKQARQLRAQYGQLFEAGAGGKIVQKILTKSETPEQTVNYLFGVGALGRKSQSAIAARQVKTILGEGSEGWNSMRELAWMRLTRNAKGEIATPKVLAKNIDEVFNQNSSLMGELYNPDETALIKRLGRAMKDVTTDPTNPSKTAFALENAIRSTIRRFGQRESFTKGNVGTGALLQFIARSPIPALQGPMREFLARRSISTIPTPRVRPSTGRARETKNIMIGVPTSGATQLFGTDNGR